MSRPKFLQVLGWAVVAALVIGDGAITRAQVDGFVGTDQPATGKIVPIAPGGSGITLGDADGSEPQFDSPAQVELPKYWIGILLAPIPDSVRAQVEIPVDEGVLVRQVVPESPAAKAGIEVFDIVLKANDQPVASGSDLMELVKQVGESGGKIQLDVLRRGQHQSIALTPEARPESTDNAALDANSGQGFRTGGAMQGMRGMPGFGPGGRPLQFRAFGPGTAFSQQGFGLNQMPNGVSVSIQKQNDQPARITVKRGNDSWEIVGDDPASLAQLPEDVRPFVERLLSDSGSMTMQMPPMPGMMGPGMRGFDDDEMQQQLHRMERQLQEMQMMFDKNRVQPGTVVPQSDLPNDEHAEAPAE